MGENSYCKSLALFCCVQTLSPNLFIDWMKKFCFRDWNSGSLDHTHKNDLFAKVSKFLATPPEAKVLPMHSNSLDKWWCQERFWKGCRHGWQFCHQQKKDREWVIKFLSLGSGGGVSGRTMQFCPSGPGSNPVKLILLGVGLFLKECVIQGCKRTLPSHFLFPIII